MTDTNATVEGMTIPARIRLMPTVGGGTRDVRVVDATPVEAAATHDAVRVHGELAERATAMMPRSEYEALFRSCFPDVSADDLEAGDQRWREISHGKLMPMTLDREASITVFASIAALRFIARVNAGRVEKAATMFHDFASCSAAVMLDGYGEGLRNRACGFTLHSLLDGFCGNTVIAPLVVAAVVWLLTDDGHGSQIIAGSGSTSSLSLDRRSTLERS